MIEGAATDLTSPDTTEPAVETSASAIPGSGLGAEHEPAATAIGVGEVPAEPSEETVAGASATPQADPIGAVEGSQHRAAATRQPDEAERGRSNFATAMAVAIVVMAGAIIYLFYQMSSSAPDRSAEINGLSSRLAALEARPTPDTGALSRQAAAAQTGAAQAEAAVAALTKRIDGMAPPPAPPNVQPQIADLQNSLGDMRKSLASLQSTVAALPRPDMNRVEARFGDIEGRLSGLQAAIGAIPHIDLGPVTGKVDALESRLKPLEAEVQAAQAPQRVAERRAAPVAVTAQAVVEAIAAGQAFPQEFRALQVLGVDPAKLAPLQVVATNGAPTLADLQDDLAQARARVVADGAPAPRGSYMDRLMSGATSLVQVRPLGTVVGDTPAAIVSRINEEIASDDLTAALADWQKLPEASRTASKSLPERIKLRLDAETAARDIAANAIGAMAEAHG